MLAVAVFMVAAVWLLFSPGLSLSTRLDLLTMLALEGVSVLPALTEATEMVLVWSSTKEQADTWRAVDSGRAVTLGLSFLDFLKLCLNTLRTLRRPTLHSGSTWSWFTLFAAVLGVVELVLGEILLVVMLLLLLLELLLLAGAPCRLSLTITDLRASLRLL